MIKNKYFRIAVLLMLLVSFTGCAALQRKFTRKKRKEQKGAAVVTTYDYAKELRVDELYKRHFVFWKSSQSDLIDRLDGHYKKRTALFHRTIESLKEMEKYLAREKGEELTIFIKEVGSVEPDINNKKLSKTEIYNTRQLLERTMREIDRKFSYSDVKDFLELRSDAD